MIWKNGQMVEETEEEQWERRNGRKVNPCENCADDCTYCPVNMATERGEI